MVVFHERSILESISVKDFATVGDGIADDTVPIQAAINECNRQLRAIQPSGGSYNGSCPELFFPSGKYKITSELSLNSYQSVRGIDAIINQQNATARSLVFAACYRNRVQGVQFVGGTNQIDFSNANIDSTMLTVRDCSFQGATDFAIRAKGTTGDLHMSASMSIDRCVFDGAKAVYSFCDSSQLNDCWIQFRGTNVTDGTVNIVNQGGVMGLTNVLGVPSMPAVGSDGHLAKAHWIDNYGSIIAHKVRWGGEFGGVPIIFDYGDPNLVNPWTGRKIVISSCQVSCGQDSWPYSALITLFGVPQRVSVTNCDGIVSNSIPVIKAGDGYDLAGKVASVTANANPSNCMYAYSIQGNQFYCPTPIPSCLTPWVR